ncbi:MAG: hypothetical protein JRH10_11710 [Deltaproteobacteria bacterium]|nr:hypothetical protein [Deltaproteobacteria bacterium]MBW2444506.1 hypothetical protein [Deltaproteobacteria bacterium]
MKIEILYFDGCPNHAPTVERAREVIRELGLDTVLHEVAIHDQSDAERLRFIGSPSVRVDGADIEPSADGHGQFGVGCRMYGSSGVPPRELMLDAFRQ